MPLFATKLSHGNKKHHKAQEDSDRGQITAREPPALESTNLDNWDQCLHEHSNPHTKTLLPRKRKADSNRHHKRRRINSNSSSHAPKHATRRDYIKTVWIDRTAAPSHTQFDILLDSASNLSHMDVPKYPASQRAAPRNPHTVSKPHNNSTESRALPTERFYTHTPPVQPTNLTSLTTTHKSLKTTEQKDYISLHESHVDEDPLLYPCSPTSNPPIASITKQLKDDPTNIALWLHLTHLHEVNAPTNISKHSLQQKISATLQNALTHNPADPQLISAYMTLQQDLMDRVDLRKLWDRVLALEECRTNMSLWLQYIDFVKHSLHSFECADLRGLYSSALDALNGSSSDIDLMHLLFAYCWFEKEAGFEERAIALLQANVEFNLLGHGSNDMEAFKSFWVRESPRIGEANAVGWGHEEHSIPTTNRSSPACMTSSDLMAHLNQKTHLPTDFSKADLTKWLHEERTASHLTHLPRRPLNDAPSTLTQPHSFVTFGDIEPFLITITSHHTHLLYLFLEFLGVSIFYTQSSMNDALTHHLVTSREDSSHLNSILSFSNDLLSITPTKFDWKPHRIQWSSASEHEFHIVERVLTLGLKFYPQDTILQLTLVELEAQRNPQSALKRAEDMLRNDRDNIVLWNFCAQLSFKVGSLRKARKIFDLALQQITGSISEGMQKSMVSLIFRTYAELEISSGNDENALHVLISLAEFLKEGRLYSPLVTQSTTNQGRIGAAKEVFEQWIRNTFKSSDDAHKRDIELPMCAALFFHITESIHRACQVFEQCIDAQLWPQCTTTDVAYFSPKAMLQVYPSQTPRVGDTLEQYVALLYLRYVFGVLPHKAHEGNLSLFSTKQKQEVIVRVLQRFPAHPLPLALLLEQKISNYRRILMHRTLDELQLRCSSPILAFFAVCHELRGEAVHIGRVRCILERALQHPKNRSNVMLWRLYLRFEQNHGDGDSANKIRVRALQHCPHSKKVWMDCLGLFASMLDAESLQSMAGIMIEKGIRVWHDRAVLDSTLP